MVENQSEKVANETLTGLMQVVYLDLYIYIYIYICNVALALAIVVQVWVSIP